MVSVLALDWDESGLNNDHRANQYDRGVRTLTQSLHENSSFSVNVQNLYPARISAVSPAKETKVLRDFP